MGRSRAAAVRQNREARRGARREELGAPPIPPGATAKTVIVKDALEKVVLSEYLPSLRQTIVEVGRARPRKRVSLTVNGFFLPVQISRATESSYKILNLALRELLERGEVRVPWFLPIAWMFSLSMSDFFFMHS